MAGDSASPGNVPLTTEKLPTTHGRGGRPTQGLLPVLRHWNLLILATTLLSGVAGVAVTSDAPAVYESGVRVLVGPYEADYETIRASSGLVQTHVGLVTSDAVVEAAATSVGVADLDDAIDDIRVIGNDVTRVITITVRSESATMSSDVANALATELARLTASSDLETGQIRVLDAATVPSSPAEPRGVLLAALAAMSGLVISLGLALLLDRFSTRLRGDDDIIGVTGLPILGHVRGLRAASTDPVERMREAAGEGGATMRFMVERMMRAASGSHVPSTLSIVPVSEDPRLDQFVQDLALTLASFGHSVLVVTTCSTRRAASVAGESGGDVPSLPEFLTDQSSERGIPRVRDGQVRTVMVDPSGQMLLSQDGLLDAMAGLSAKASVALFDLGELDSSVTTLAVAMGADATILVVRDGQGRREQFSRATEYLAGSRGVVAGVVVLDSSGRSRRQSNAQRHLEHPTDARVAPRAT